MTTQGPSSTPTPTPPEPKSAPAKQDQSSIDAEHARRLLLAGYGLFVVAAVSFTTIPVMVFTRIRDGGIEKAYLDGAPDKPWLLILSPLPLLFFAGLVTSGVGYMILSAAGAASREIIPNRDRKELWDLMQNNNEKGMDQYVRLHSLTGLTGFFTKVGLTGLPLATIGLTVFLAIVGIWHETFFQLAQLTLGAFLGSFVQKKQEFAAVGVGADNGGHDPPSSGRKTP